jgi:hypothetical protein
MYLFGMMLSAAPAAAKPVVSTQQHVLGASYMVQQHLHAPHPTSSEADVRGRLPAHDQNVNDSDRPITAGSRGMCG